MPAISLQSDEHPHPHASDTLESWRAAVAREQAARMQAETLAESAIARFYEEQQSLLLLQAIAVAANEAETCAAAMTVALERICQYTDWPFGHLLLGEEAGPQKEPRFRSVLWHASNPADLAVFRAAVPRERSLQSPGLLRRLLDSARPEWGAEPDAADALAGDLAHACGVRWAFAFPILVGGRVQGVMEFLAPAAATPPARLLSVLPHVGKQLGIVLERERQQEKVRRSEAYFRRLTDNALDLITILEADGTIRYESHSIESVLGHKPEEYRGKNAFSFVHPEDVPHVAQAFQQALERRGNTPSLTFRFRHRDGSYRTLEGCGNNLLDDPVVAGIVFNSRDVTERKKLEEQFFQSQKVQAIGQLAGGVAHDFNNILTAILGYCDLSLPQLVPGGAVAQNLGEIHKAAQRAASLTRQLLAFSRKQVLQPRVLDLNLVVAEMDKLLRRLLGEHIDLVTLLPRDLGRIQADPGQLEQILMNLAVNARDAMPEGGRLTIQTADVVLDAEYCRLRPEMVPGDYVMLAVSDNGTGMSPEVQARVFEPFFTTKRKGEGTGLGLATCHGIVKQSGGHIAVYSERGHGTTFKVYLPRVELPLDAGSPAPPNATPIQGGHETVLLVEDEPMLRELGSTILRELGYHVLPASNGLEALRLLETRGAEPVDLLITDVVMPEMGGVELAANLRARSPHTKVIFCSGYTEDAILRGGVLQRGAPFLQKPYSVATFAACVRQVIEDGDVAPSLAGSAAS